MIPDDLQYTKDHEWVRTEDDTVRVGVTDYAQEALGDIVFVTLPEAGSQVSAGETCGEVESTKSVSDLYAPLSGTVVRRRLDARDPARRRHPRGTAGRGGLPGRPRQLSLPDPDLPVPVDHVTLGP